MALGIARRQRHHIDLQILHAECEVNYARLLKIFPAIAHAERRLIGISDPAQQTRRYQFSVTERSRYTTALEIAEFGLRPAWGLSATFNVRLYHDASMAEVMAFQHQRNVPLRSEYPNRHMHLPDEKRQWNFLLGEWLVYCLAYGFTLDAPEWDAAP
jgi:hypothetical protein